MRPVSRPLILTLLSHFRLSHFIHTFAPLSHYPPFAFYTCSLSHFRAFALSHFITSPLTLAIFQSSGPSPDFRHLVKILLVTEISSLRMIRIHNMHAVSSRYLRLTCTASLFPLQCLKINFDFILFLFFTSRNIILNILRNAQHVEHNVP